MHELSATSSPFSRRPAMGGRDGAPTMAGLLARLLMRMGAALRWYARRSEQRREAASIRDALAELDAYALHDLGFDPSEIDSVAAEMTGAADVTRARVAQSRASGASRI